LQTFANSNVMPDTLDFKKLTGFFKRNLAIILTVIIAGNLIYFLRVGNESPFYRASVKIKTKSAVYDRLTEILRTSLNEQDPAFQKQGAGSFSSYRSEDNYIFEILVDFPDSAGAGERAISLIAQIKNDSLINELYFKRIEAIDQVIQHQNRLIETADSMLVLTDRLTGYDLQFKKTTYQVNNINLANIKINLLKEFAIYPFNDDSIVYYGKPGMSKLFKYNVILLFAGIFLAVFIRQLRK